MVPDGKKLGSPHIKLRSRNTRNGQKTVAYVKFLKKSSMKKIRETVENFQISKKEIRESQNSIKDEGRASRTGRVFLSKEKEKDISNWLSKQPPEGTNTEDQMFEDLLPPRVVSKKQALLTTGSKQKITNMSTKAVTKDGLPPDSKKKTPFSKNLSNQYVEKSEQCLDTIPRVLKPVLKTDKTPPSNGRPLRQRPPQQLQKWRPVLDNEGNLKLQGSSVWRRGMNAGRLITTHPVEDWRQDRLVQTTDKKTYELVGEVFDPSEEIPPHAKQIMMKQGAVDWKLLRAFLQCPANNDPKKGKEQQGSEYAVLHNAMCLENSVKRVEADRRGKKRAYPNEAKDVSSPVPSKKLNLKGPSLIASTPTSSGMAKRVFGALPNHINAKRLSFSPNIADYRSIQIQKYNDGVHSPLTNNRDADRMLKSPRKPTSTKRSTNKMQNPHSNSSFGILKYKARTKRAVVLVSPLKRSGHPAKHLKQSNNFHSKHNSCKESEPKNASSGLIEEAAPMQSVLPKSPGRPVTRSLTTRAMRSLYKSRASSNIYVSPKYPPRLWKAVISTPRKRMYSQRRTYKTGHLHQIGSKNTSPAKPHHPVMCILSPQHRPKLRNTAQRTNTKTRKISEKQEENVTVPSKEKENNKPKPTKETDKLVNKMGEASSSTSLPLQKNVAAQKKLSTKKSGKNVSPGECSRILAMQKAVNKPLLKENPKPKLPKEKSQKPKLPKDKSQKPKLPQEKSQKPKSPKEKSQKPKLSKEKSGKNISPDECSRILTMPKVVNKPLLKENPKLKLPKEKSQKPKLPKDKSQKPKVPKDKSPKPKVTKDKSQKLKLPKDKSQKSKVDKLKPVKTICKKEPKSLKGHGKKTKKRTKAANGYLNSLPDEDKSSVGSLNSDSSCGPSASVVFALRQEREMQEMKAPRTLRERQEQDMKVELLQQQVAADLDDDPLACLNLLYSGITNENCDYTQLLTKRRRSKSDSCCTPPTRYMIDEEGSNEDAVSSVATPSLLSWEPQKKDVQRYVQRQRSWNSQKRRRGAEALSAAKNSGVLTLPSMDYSQVRVDERDSDSDDIFEKEYDEDNE